MSQYTYTQIQSGCTHVESSAIDFGQAGVSYSAAVEFCVLVIIYSLALTVLGAWRGVVTSNSLSGEESGSRS